MATQPPRDVLSPIDLRTMADARNWANSAMEKRPWREEFFRAIVLEIQTNKTHDASVLELGSGPGFFAERLLGRLPLAKYVGLDFSPAMHALATERLGPLTDRTQLIEADFKKSRWNAGLGRFDVVVAIQSVHELRHKRYAPSLYRAIRESLTGDGIFLMCDHFIGAGGMDDRDLYMTLEEHELALSAGGFSEGDILLQQGGLILFRARSDKND